MKLKGKIDCRVVTNSKARKRFAQQFSRAKLTLILEHWNGVCGINSGNNIKINIFH